jgi:hypothetical protein
LKTHELQCTLLFMGNQHWSACCGCTANDALLDWKKVDFFHVSHRSRQGIDSPPDKPKDFYGKISSRAARCLCR